MSEFYGKDGHIDYHRLDLYNLRLNGKCECGGDLASQYDTMWYILRVWCLKCGKEVTKLG